MKIIDKKLLAEVRRCGECGWCKKPLRFAAEPHHLFSRGAGRIDQPWNLIALGGPWDCDCHGEFHRGHIRRYDLLTVVAQREGRSQDEIEEEVWRIRRLPKGSVYEAFAGQRPVPLVGGDQPSEVHRGPHRPRSFGGAQGVEADEGWQAFGDV